MSGRKIDLAPFRLSAEQALALDLAMRGGRGRIHRFVGGFWLSPEDAASDPHELARRGLATSTGTIAALERKGLLEVAAKTRPAALGGRAESFAIGYRLTDKAREWVGWPPRAETVVKCSCGFELDAAEWLALPLDGVQHVAADPDDAGDPDAYELELRTCPVCFSTNTRRKR